jgi:cellulose biosynthesis protein BcsQ
MALNVLMYSFKGGAGRTVSTANLAVILAKELGLKVALLDLDVESAGTSVLFNLETRKGAAEDKHFTIQDILRGSYQPPPRAGAEGAAPARVTIDINRLDFEQSIWPQIHSDIPIGNSNGYLKVLPSRPIIHNTDEGSGYSNDSQTRFENLLYNIENLSKPPDIVLMDSASGLQATAHLGLMKCDVLTIFFRWTRQFMFGTTRFLTDYLTHNPRIVKRIKRVILVPTAVPTGTPEDDLVREHEKRKKNLDQDVELVNSRVHKANPKLPERWAEVHEPVYESDLLKWDDRILLLDTLRPANDTTRLLHDYLAIAETLRGLTKSLKGSTR